MISSIKNTLILVILSLFVASCSQKTNNTLNLQPLPTNQSEDRLKPIMQKAKRILFIGDSITYQGGMVVNTELWLKKLYPNQEFELINIGLPSETITGLSEKGHAGGKFPRPYLHDRLTSILDKIQPDLIITMYGINCGIYQPYNAKHEMLYQKGYLALHKAIIEREIPSVYITSPMYDHQKGDTAALDYNEKVLGSFTRWLLQKKNEDWNVINLYKTMNQQLLFKRKSNPKFFYQHDGIHMVDEGYWLLSNLIMNYFEPEKMNKKFEQAPSIDNAMSLASQLSYSPQQLLSVITQKMHLTRDAWLTHTGHTRPNLAVGLPMQEYKEQVKKLTEEIEILIDK